MDKQTMTNESAPLVASPKILAEHHRELDACIERLLARVRDGDPTELRPEWSAFERALLRHLEQEEVEILPGIGADGRPRSSYTARGTLDRQTFGLHWNQDLDIGGVVVGDEVEIVGHAELVNANGATAAGGSPGPVERG